MYENEENDNPTQIHRFYRNLQRKYPGVQPADFGVQQKTGGLNAAGRGRAAGFEIADKAGSDDGTDGGDRVAARGHVDRHRFRNAEALSHCRDRRAHHRDYPDAARFSHYLHVFQPEKIWPDAPSSRIVTKQAGTGIIKI